MLRELGFDVPSFPSYFSDNLPFGTLGNTIVTPGVFGSWETIIDREQSYLGCSELAQFPFHDFMVTIYHESVGHAQDNVYHLEDEPGDPNALGEEDFNDKYEQPVWDAINEAKKSGKWDEALKKCRKSCEND